MRDAPSAAVVSELWVLVIDDEPDMPRLLGRLLGKDRRIHFESATTGAAGLQKLRAREYDLVFCDIMMPEVSGIDVYETLAVEQPAMAKRLVMMTGGVFTERATQFVERYQLEPLEKPFDVALLEGLVADALRRRTTAAGAFRS